MSNNLSERDPVEILAEEYSERLRAGDSPTIEEYVQRKPECEQGIRALFPSIEMMERASHQQQEVRLFDGRLQRLSSSSSQCLGGFQLIREIGRGGMGVVYEAEHLALKRRVALKVLLNIAASEKQLARFRREAEAAAALHHTNIVPVFEIGEDQGLQFFAMPFIDGVPLCAAIDQISQNRTPQSDEPPEDCPQDSPVAWGVGNEQFRHAARIAADVADALEYAHQHGVVHRDIKPGNILLGSDDTVWVMDFGLARHESLDAVTNTGDIVGTLRYMAPEQLSGSFDARSDIYSLGLTLFEMVTLRPAFEQSRQGPLIVAKISETVPTVRSLDRRVPPDLKTIILKASADDPSHRYQTAGELASDLHRFLEYRPIRARPINAAERAWRWARRNPTIAGLTALAATLLAVVVIVSEAGKYQTRQALTGMEQEYRRAEENRKLAQQSVEETKTALADARKQRLLAEANLQLAVQAFERIMENVSSRGGRPFAVDFADGEYQTASAVLGPADVELLETLLAFFGRFAQANDVDLTGQFADAQRRVGNILHQLGRIQEAILAYRKSLAAYQAIATSAPPNLALCITQAQIYNELALAMGQHGDATAARDLQRETREFIEAVPEVREAAAGRFELARSLIILSSAAVYTEPIRPTPKPRGRPRERKKGPPGGRFVPRGPRGRPSPAGNRRIAGQLGELRGPPAVRQRLEEDLDAMAEAIGILTALWEEEPNEAKYQLALAQAHREQARLSQIGPGGQKRGHKRGRAESYDTAIHLLENLVAAYPEAPPFRYELAQLLCSLNAGSNAQEIEQAIAICERLATSFPGTSEYQGLLATALRRRAKHQVRAGQLTAARDSYLRGLNLLESLGEQYPDVSIYDIAHAQLLADLADAESKLGAAEEAKTHFDAAIARLETYTQGRRDVSFVRRFLGQLKAKRNQL